jgi:hypothetical protein
MYFLPAGHKYLWGTGYGENKWFLFQQSNSIHLNLNKLGPK